MMLYGESLIPLKTAEREEENSVFLEPENSGKGVNKAVGGGAVIIGTDLSTNVFSSIDVLSESLQDRGRI